jgi:hypothetical protein
VVVELRRQALREEAGEEEDRADGQERERTRDGAQLGEVIEEQLAEADAEERQPGTPERTPAVGQPDVEERKPSAPQSALTALCPRWKPVCRLAVESRTKSSRIPSDVA